jgi:hypothetical protein
VAPWQRFYESLKAIRRFFLRHKREWDDNRRFNSMKRNAIKKTLNASKPMRKKVKVLFAPTNSAGQGYEWAQVLSQTGIPAESLRVVSDRDELFPSTHKVAREEIVKYQDREKFAQRIASQYSHIFWESLRPLFSFSTEKGAFTAHNAVDDIALMKKAKKKVAVIFHGSDIRDTDYHILHNRFSPFAHAGEELIPVKKRAEELRAQLPQLRKMKIPFFVTTPDLFHEVPDARWLPLVIDTSHFGKIAQQSPAFAHGGKPRVLYLPSKSWIKSAEIITPILEELDSEGVITWVKSERVVHEKLPDLLSQVDVVVDQFVGIVGVLPLEAMAAGRLVLTHCAKWANKALPEIPPVIDVTPETLEKQLRNLSSLSREEITSQVNAGILFVGKYHNGDESRKALISAFGNKGFLKR